MTDIIVGLLLLTAGLIFVYLMLTAMIPGLAGVL